MDIKNIIISAIVFASAGVILAFMSNVTAASLAIILAIMGTVAGLIGSVVSKRGVKAGIGNSLIGNIVGSLLGSVTLLAITQQRVSAAAGIEVSLTEGLGDTLLVFIIFAVVGALVGGIVGGIIGKKLEKPETATQVIAPTDTPPTYNQPPQQ